MAKYDPETGLQLLQKQPAESRSYNMDFDKVLNLNETLSSITSVTIRPKRDVIGSVAPTIDAQTIVGDKVQLALSGGTHGERYHVEIRVLTSEGETIEGDGILLVKD